MDDGLELALLHLFEALYRERHLSRAATLTGRSQPAMSRALARLRQLFDDPLFVRTAQGMIPTPRAHALAGEVHELLERARALVTPVRFTPHTLQRTFFIATSELVQQELMSGIIERVAALAPAIDIAFVPIGSDLEECLRSGRVDLVIAPLPTIPAGLQAQHLFDDGFLCAVRKGHPHVKETLTLADYTALAHIQIAPRGLPGGPVDDALAARGLSRRVAVRTPSFLAAPLLLAGSDLVLTAPSRVLLSLAEPLGLRTFPPPIPVEGFRIHQAWHPRVQHDEAHRFFRKLVASTSRKRSVDAGRTSSSKKARP